MDNDRTVSQRRQERTGRFQILEKNWNAVRCQCRFSLIFLISEEGEGLVVVVLLHFVAFLFVIVKSKSVVI